MRIAVRKERYDSGHDIIYIEKETEDADFGLAIKPYAMAAV